MAITARQVSLAGVGVGVLLVVYGAWQWWDGERTFARRRATTCTVLNKTVDATLLVSSGRTSGSSRGRGFRPATGRIREEAHLVLSHTVDGRQHRFSEDFVYDWSEYAKVGYQEGKDYPCRYDPKDPGRGTIRRAFDSTGAMDTVALGSALMLIATLIPGIWREVARYYEMRGR